MDRQQRQCASDHAGVRGESIADLETVLTLDVTELMLGVSRGTPAKVVYELENALHAMKADGSYQRIFRRWFPSETPPRHVVESESSPTNLRPTLGACPRARRSQSPDDPEHARPGSFRADAVLCR